MDKNQLQVAKQHKLSFRLKLVAGAVALIGLAVFIMFTIQSFTVGAEDPGTLYFNILTVHPKINIYFTWVTAIFCYAILFQFWKITDEIGKDNSFSKENARHFHQMTILSVLVAVQYLIRIVAFIFLGETTMISVYYRAGMSLIFMLFAVLTEALSGLVLNAYLMKQEQDLTI